ncbi:MAG: NFACT RNA binding domain-containing protein [Bacteroidota bacterium]
MLSNYFTLVHISRLLNDRFVRTVIAQVYSQDKNTLSILLYAPEPYTITISCNARKNYIVGNNGDARARTNSVDLFPLLIDQHILSVYVDLNDRIVYMQLSGKQWLCLEMFASKANVLLRDESGTVIDAFLNKKELISTVKEFQRTELPVTPDNIVPDRDKFIATILENNTDQTNLTQVLKKTVPKLGSILVNEITYKLSSAPQALSIEIAEKIYSITINTINTLLQLNDVAPLLYFEENSPLCLSLIPLEHYSAYHSETYKDLFFGIQKFISFERSTASFLQKKKEISSWLTKEKEKAERTTRSVESELGESSRSEQYELYANLIMAHLSSINKGTTSVQLTNLFSHDNTLITIPLDSSLSPQKNAEKYFEKAKKAKHAREETQKRLLLLKQRLTSVSDLLEKSNDINDSFSLKNFIQSYGGVAKELGFMTDKEQEELPPFKIFVVEGGFTVYAGKNSANNDLLTFRYAKPNDLWFHARGSSGSHVVLKLGSSQGTPTKKAVEQAASIAAYYSKMKNAKHVPVAMTERKYIHKPKGAPAGTVALDKEKVIFVQPVLPGKEQ